MVLSCSPGSRSFLSDCTDIISLFLHPFWKCPLQFVDWLVVKPTACVVGTEAVKRQDVERSCLCFSFVAGHCTQLRTMVRALVDEEGRELNRFHEFCADTKKKKWGNTIRVDCRSPMYGCSSYTFRVEVCNGVQRSYRITACILHDRSMGPNPTAMLLNEDVA